MYVGNEEYQDMQAWAESNGVDFEDFFIHYAEETMEASQSHGKRGAAQLVARNPVGIKY